MLKVDVPGQVDRPRPDRDFQRLRRVAGGDLVQVDQADRSVRRRTAVDHAAPVREERDLLAHRGGADRRGMLFLGRLEAADPLVHVPAEGADRTDVVVEVHLAIGDDVQAGLLLIVDRGMGGIGVRFGVVGVLEGHPDISAQQLVVEPVRSRV
jgi:hypothetical protein